MLSELAEAKQRILRLEKENRDIRRELIKALDDKDRLCDQITEIITAARRTRNVK